MNRIAEDGIVDPFVVGYLQVVARLRVLDAVLQAGPACKSVFTRDGELRIAECNRAGKDYIIRRTC